MGDITSLLAQWRNGDKQALDALVPLVYDELHRIAHAHLRGERIDHPLQTTALVHEAYVRLVDITRLTFDSRTHFFAMAARLMRQVLVDHARRERAVKRGGGVTIRSLDGVDAAVSENMVDVLALDAALHDLEALDSRLCRVVELKYFAGLTIDETAAALELSPVTIERDWAMAKAWLYKRLSDAAR
jgi:RNA polymerase sigma-70 factor (ECF subfamily)